EDVFLAFSPERIDPGNPTFKVKDIPKVVGGVTPVCTRLAAELYREIVPGVHEVSSPKVAELAKLYENVFRNVNIALANELALICRQVGVPTREVIEAAASKPFGFMPFYPGPGIGGHCIGIDPIYLAWKLRAGGYEARFIHLADEINRAMPAHTVAMVTAAASSSTPGWSSTPATRRGVSRLPTIASSASETMTDVVVRKVPSAQAGPGWWRRPAPAPARAATPAVAGVEAAPSVVAFRA